MKNGGMTFSLNLTIIQHKTGIEIQKEIIYNPPSNTLNEKFSKSVNIFFARANFFSNEAFHKGTSFQNGEALHTEIPHGYAPRGMIPVSYVYRP